MNDSRLKLASFVGALVGLGVSPQLLKPPKGSFTKCSVCGNPCRTNLCHKCKQKQEPQDART